MSWSVLIPLKAPAERKSRLAGRYDAAWREALAEAMYRHVYDCVERAGVFQTILTLSPPQRGATPSPRWVQRHPDLNVELSRARRALACPLLVLNADLPLLEPADLLTMVRAAESAGCAVAPDRHGTGTNAAAMLPEAAFAFAFGPDSLSAHLRAARHAGIVCRTGLACDLDTPADVAHLLASESALPERVAKVLFRARAGHSTAWAHVD